MTKKKWLQKSGAALATLLFSLPVIATTWAPVGDQTLRSDIEILSAHGLIEGLVTTWPIPAGQLRQLSSNQALSREPEFVQAAARRVIGHLNDQDLLQELRPILAARFTTKPNVVRDFGIRARNQIDVSGGFDWHTQTASIALHVGRQTSADGDDSRLSFDGSHFTTVWESMNTLFYGGQMDRWYGPGWISSLFLSNNARPFPKLGLMRNNPRAFETWWLSWLGPWQADFFVGLLDDPRIDTHTVLGSLRLSFEPVQGLEVGLTRITQFCGRNHTCNPFKAAFDFRNSNTSRNDISEEAGLDLKYTHQIGSLAVSPYAQLMNEDNGPYFIEHTFTSYLIGASLAGTFDNDGSHWRLTAEHTDSVATLDSFNFDTRGHGVAYNNGAYPDGFRYRGRTTGFSLDSDSRLSSIAGAITDNRNRSYRLAYHHAAISTAELAAIQAGGSTTRNAVSTQPVTLNQLELGISIPLRQVSLEFTLRGQDKNVMPSSGAKVAADAGMVWRF